jgi:PAS domain S-box-containing protein
MELVEDLTGSKISFIHLIHQGGEEIELVAWSRRTLEHYCHASYDSHYPVSKAGIWADALREGKAVIFNDYLSYPHKHGLPEGHSMLLRLISVPVVENGRVVMLAGVGNKETTYTEFDSESVQLMATSIWQIVKEARAEKSLLEAKERFDRLAHHVPGALYQFQFMPDGSAKLPYASMGIEHIYGVLPEHVEDHATELFASIHPDDILAVRESIQESALSLRKWKNRHRVNLKDGRMIWVEGEATPETQPDGSILWHGYVHDVTEDVHREEANKARAVRMTSQRNLISQLMFDDSVVNSPLDAALDIVTSRLANQMDVDRVSVWLLSDDQATFHREVLYDRTGTDATKSQYRTADIPSYVQALRNDGQVDADDVMNDPRTKELITDDLLPNRIHSLLDSAIQQDGRLIGVVCVESRGAIRTWQSDEKTFLTTISTLVSQLYTNAERKKAVEELRLLSRAVESSSISVVITDTEGTIRYVNPYFLKTTGYAFDDVVGQNPRVLNSGKQTKEFYQDLWQTITSGKEWTGEFLNVKKNGEHYWESALITPILNSKTGAITHFVAIKEDITEKKKVMEDLVSTMNDKDHLVQELAHRSYNNIQVIMAFIEYLLMMHPDLSLEEFATEVNGQIQSMVLALRQLNKGDQLSKIDLGEYLKALAENVVSRRSNGVAVRLHVDLMSIQVLLDSALPVGAVLNELLANAVKHAFNGNQVDEPAEIRLSCGRSDDEEIEIRMHVNGDDWVNVEGRLDLAISTVREQLGGEIRIDTTNGTSIRITYKDNRYSERV